MPHDRRGQRIKAGDRVLIRATVTEVFEGEEACNATFQVDHGEGAAADEYAPLMTFNTRLVELEEPAPETPEQERGAANAHADEVLQD